MHAAAALSNIPPKWWRTEGGMTSLSPMQWGDSDVIRWW